MKLTAFFIATLISVSSFAQASNRDLSDVKQLKIMEYNVENMFMHLGKYAKMPLKDFEKMTDSELKSDSDLQGVATAIKDENPDLMVVEEVEDIETLSTFASKYLNGAYQAYLVDGNDDRGIQIGYLVKKDLPLSITLESHKDVTWVDPTDHQTDKLFSRDAPALLIRRQRDRSDAPPALIFIGNHAKSQRDRGGDPGSNILRTAQMKAIGSIVDDYQKEYGPNTPIILGGDFNVDVRNNPQVQPIRDRMDDAFDIMGVRGLDRVTQTFHPRNGSAEFHQLDALFVAPCLKDNVVSIEAYRYKDASGNAKPLPQTFEERSRNPSDHFPIVMTLTTQEIFPEAYK